MREKIELEKIMKDFYSISGIRISLHDTEFNEIYSYPKSHSAFCTYMQGFSCVKQNCIDCDRKAFDHIKETGELFFYKCHLGLCEATIPLYSFGVLSGYLMMGQFTDSDSLSISNILNRTNTFVNDINESKKLCEQITTIKREKIDPYINIMTLLGEYLTSTNRAFSSSADLPKMIKEYLNRNYKSKITIDTLSKKFGYCNVTITKCFKKAFGTTIVDYLNTVRLEKAAEFIVKSNTSFKQIANSCGFFDQNYFSKTFAKHFGLSPTEYRQKYADNTHTNQS